MRRFDRPDGSIMHPEADTDGSVILIADADANHRAFPVGLQRCTFDGDTLTSRRRAIRREPVCCSAEPKHSPAEHSHLER